jgi:hypothetical protein
MPIASYGVANGPLQSRRQERREQVSTGELEKIRAENQAAREAAERAFAQRPAP